MTKPLHIALSALDFARLVNGKEIEHEVDGKTVKIILSDIGFDVMQDRLDEAEGEAYKAMLSDYVHEATKTKQ